MEKGTVPVFWQRNCYLNDSLKKGMSERLAIMNNQDVLILSLKIALQSSINNEFGIYVL